MVKAEGDPERTMNGFVSVARLLEEPRLGRLYTFVLRAGEVTIDNVVDELEMPRMTAYSDAGTLVDLGVLSRDETRKTHTYEATPIVLSTDLDGVEYTITPALVGHHSESITEAADVVDRDVKDVHRNLVEFAELGVVEFVTEGRAKRPVARYDGLRIDVPFVDHPTEGTITSQAD